MAPRVAAITPAKLNLGLEVIGRRPDGYHEIATIMQAVSLYDRLVWTATGQPFRYEPPAALTTSSDLVARAIETAGDRDNWTGTLRLVKDIPMAAGLGGGSSDAALALRLAHPDRTNEELEPLATSLGSDVPFFLTGGTALAAGTGTQLEALPTPDLWFVILTPDVSIPDKTRTLYQALDESDFTDGARIEALAATIRTGEPLTAPFPNAFERHLRTYPAIEGAYAALQTAGAPWVAVSGAGPSLYVALPTWSQAASIARRLSREIGAVNIARSISAQYHHQTAENLARRLRGDRLAR